MRKSPTRTSTSPLSYAAVLCIRDTLSTIDEQQKCVHTIYKAAKVAKETKCTFATAANNKIENNFPKMSSKNINSKISPKYVKSICASVPNQSVHHQENAKRSVSQQPYSNVTAKQSTNDFQVVHTDQTLVPNFPNVPLDLRVCQALNQALCQALNQALCQALNQAC